MTHFITVLGGVDAFHTSFLRGEKGTTSELVSLRVVQGQDPKVHHKNRRNVPNGVALEPAEYNEIKANISAQLQHILLTPLKLMAVFWNNL